MPRGTSMYDWFENNPTARDKCEQFVTKRREGDQTSVRKFLMALIDECEFPFSSEPSIIRYLEAEMGLGKRLPTVRPKEEQTPEALVTYELPKSRKRAIRKARSWVITAAQNNTPVVGEFLQAIEGFAKLNKAEIIVRPIRYRNPTSNIVPEHEVPEGMWWDWRVERYLADGEVEMKDVVIPDVRIAATAANPLTGLDARSGSKHGIYGATQLSMKTVATPQQELPKILYSTGAVTAPNYSTTKSGNLAEFRHSLSAVIVEQDGRGRTFLRSVSWDGECFIDIDRAYYANGHEPAPSARALIPGDEHAWFVDPKVKAATYTNKDSMLHTLKPEVVVRHDLLDCYSVSHHHMGNTLMLRNKAVLGWGSIEQELDATIAFLDETSVTDAKHLIVSSNHNDHLSQWLNGGEKGVTPENALLYHRFMTWMYESAERTPTGVKMGNPFKMYLERNANYLPDVEFLGGSEPYIIGNIDVSQHGHRGPNGARGSRANLSKIGVKTVIGHSHSPGITGGCWQVGTSSRLDLEYAQGPSSWLHCHCVIHANGKRQLLPIIEGKWRQ